MTTKFLVKLRCLMKDHSILLRGDKLQAYIVPSSDAHGSEYLNDKDKRRSFITGFTGSTGTAVITEDNALLWTDGRYHLQATQQLDHNWQLMKDGLVETPSIGDWLTQNLPPHSLVGIDTTLYEENLFQSLASKLKENSCELIDTKENLVDLVRQEFEPSVAFEMQSLIKLDNKFTGKSTSEKLAEVRDYMKKIDVGSMVVSSLDEIAWVLNWRGRDIPYGTVFFAYLIVTIDKCKLFTDLKRLDERVGDTFTMRSDLITEENFEFYDYSEFFEYLKEFVRQELSKSEAKKIFLSSASSHAIHALVPEKHVYTDISYLTKLRVNKNTSEISGAKHIHTRDSVVLVEFLHKLQQKFSSFKCELNEYTLGKYLDQMRVSTPGCLSPSFETICSSGANGAIIHYKADKVTSNKIQHDNILLIDSGGHYLDLGTTDVTRSVFLGNTDKISSFQKECFTRVLKGHIQLAMRVFPSKTKPECLDSFARQALWEGGLDYRHGTGHGVGALLNVHEVPIIANRKGVDMGIEENMIMTIEPGYYQDGEFGIRIENCYLVVSAKVAHNFADMQFLKFEPLTLVPIQREFIDVDLINDEEKSWLNRYHKRVLDSIGPELTKTGKHEVYEWLVEQTKPL